MEEAWTRVEKLTESYNRDMDTLLKLLRLNTSESIELFQCISGVYIKFFGVCQQSCVDYTCGQFLKQMGLGA